MGHVAAWCMVCAIPAAVSLVAFNMSGRDAEDVSQLRATRTSASPLEASSALQAETAADKLKFDVVRIDPDGVSVFAGRGAADASVTLLDNAVAIASTRTDTNGEWAVVLERRFAAGDHQLSLSSKSEDPTDGQTVSITVAHTEPVAITHEAGAPEGIPQPITFNYDEAELTSEGRRAAASLGNYLLSERLEAVTLSGHADERGSQPYNMELSQQRLDTVAQFLRDAGYAGELVLLPKGKMEPFAIPDRKTLARDDAYKLDRRVQIYRSK
jgi:outer membrane protein OmpA-like peptidoglycan-associated protein